jgi:hypothetical protein
MGKYGRIHPMPDSSQDVSNLRIRTLKGEAMKVTAIIFSLAMLFQVMIYDYNSGEFKMYGTMQNRDGSTMVYDYQDNSMKQITPQSRTPGYERGTIYDYNTGQFQWYQTPRRERR